MELGKVELSTCCHPKPDGIELRDWFAGMALSGMIAGKYHQDTLHNPKDQTLLVNVAWCAYTLADAMMKARGKEDQ